MNKKLPKKTWLDNLIEFYDFVWQSGTDINPGDINDEIMADFVQGGDKFEQMKVLILKKFPTKKSAEAEFKKNL